MTRLKAGRMERMLVIRRSFDVHVVRINCWELPSTRTLMCQCGGRYEKDFYCGMFVLPDDMC